MTCFRASKFHTFVTDGFVSDTAKTFEVGAIPKPILVDGNGVIFATWEDLSGPALGRTLDRVSGKKK